MRGVSQPDTYDDRFRTLTRSRCSTQREQHYQRHKDIACIVRDILKLDGVVVSSQSPMPIKTRWSRVSSDFEILDHQRDVEDDSDSDDECAQSSTTEWTDYGDSRDYDDPKPGTRRERKAARRAARNRARFAGLTKSEINQVKEVLHPSYSSSHGCPDSRDPLRSSTIEANIAFNPSTFKYASLRADVYQKKVLKNKISPKSLDKERLQSEDAEITLFIEELGIDMSDFNGCTKQRRSLIAKLKQAIRNDLKCVANENQQRMMRLAGYWRYANRRTYNHMVEKNQIWDWETGAKLEVIDEGEEANEEDTTCMSGNLPGENPDVYQYPVKETALPSVTASIKCNDFRNGSRIVDTHDVSTTQNELSAEDVETKYSFEGRIDKRHLQTPIRQATPGDEEKLSTFEITTSPEENREALTGFKDIEEMKVKVKHEDKNVLQSPLQVKMKRIEGKDSIASKSSMDRNNRFSVLSVYRAEKPQTTPVPSDEAGSVSTSRRSSVRRTANIQPPAKESRPSPLRNVAGKSSPAQGLSGFPKLPATKAMKPKTKAPHPPATLSPKQAADFGKDPSNRGGHVGGASRGGHAGPVNYAAMLKNNLGK